jgi:uncharacterized membrane protein YfhO
VLSEIFYPGWKACVDGVETEIYRANYNLRSLFVRAGKHTIELTFASAPFRQGMWISLATLLCCAVGIGYSLRKKTDR